MKTVIIDGVEYTPWRPTYGSAGTYSPNTIKDSVTINNQAWTPREPHRPMNDINYQGEPSTLQCPRYEATGTTNFTAESLKHGLCLNCYKEIEQKRRP